jgi:hypothetical protein
MFRLVNARYHGTVKNRQDVFDAFFPRGRTYEEFQREAMALFPEDSQILFACVNSDLDGYKVATLLFLSEGELYFTRSEEDRYGDDDLCLFYDPCKVSWTLLWEEYSDTQMPSEAREAWKALVGHNVTSFVQIIGEEEEGIITVTRHVSGSGKLYMLVPKEFVQQHSEETG